ncbi:MAG TPA: Na/Pi cotransporter family protein [Stellaceae bacterium]|nr:Na/Pi cotransporter family protein [Stellaceae bacterium]
MSKLILLDLLGGIALLLWGLHMVHSGIMRAFGAEMRRFLSLHLNNRVKAFLAGLGITAVLQSSTATALMAGSFAAGGMLALVPALALMLGANVGTTLVVQVMSFDVSAAAPVLLFLGLIAFKRAGRTRIRDLGRVSIGLGLMLLSLHILLQTLAPAEEAPGVRSLLHLITGEPALNVVLGALLAWAAHSSVAVVILTMSLSYSSFVTPVAALALTLGANLGSAVNPLFEVGSSDNPASRRLAVGNLANRVVGCLLVAPFLAPVARELMALDPNPVRFVADFHTVFNLALAVLFLPALDGVAWLLTRLLPDRKQAADPGAPIYLDETAVEVPSVALACAARETLHMGDIVETMLRQTMTAFATNDRRLVGEIERMDNAVDKLHEAIKLYVTNLTRESLEEEDGRRAMEIIAFAINLEHIGDIIDKNLMELAAKKIKRSYSFSREGMAELEAFHRRVVDNLKLALGAFISGDVKIARQLLQEKVQVREAERAAAENHFARLREGRVESLETSSLHLDVLRDLKRIHSHLCSVAYPILEAAGELQPSRLKKPSRSRAASRQAPPAAAPAAPGRGVP